MLGRMPGLAAVVILSLGVGIGVNTAVFSWIQAMVLQPIPGVAGASTVQLVEPRADTGSYPGASWTEYQDLRARMRTLPDLFAFRMVPFTSGDSGVPERTHGLLVSGNYFSALGLKPALGRFLRRSRIDELPQVVNILKGEMSWIGPRPEASQLSSWYEGEIPYYRYRHVVRPGITGWAQVNQGHVAGIQDIRTKLQYDFYYIRNFSLWLDLVIVMKTIKTVFTGFGHK